MLNNINKYNNNNNDICMKYNKDINHNKGMI